MLALAITLCLVNAVLYAWQVSPLAGAGWVGLAGVAYVFRKWEIGR